MALPTSYLTSVKNLGSILNAIKGAQSPPNFTTRFLETLGYKSSSDRLIIAVLKNLRFLDAQGVPLERYHQYLDATQSEQILAAGIRESYSDLFLVNVNAHKMTKADVGNKFKTLSQGSYGEAVIGKMATTFVNLCKLANFDSETPNLVDPELPFEEKEEGLEKDTITSPPLAAARSLGGLHYNIQIILPETRDPEVYDALFRSLKTHLV